MFFIFVISIVCYTEINRTLRNMSMTDQKNCLVTKPTHVDHGNSILVMEIKNFECSIDDAVRQVRIMSDSTFENRSAAWMKLMSVLRVPEELIERYPLGGAGILKTVSLFDNSRDMFSAVIASGSIFLEDLLDSPHFVNWGFIDFIVYRYPDDDGWALKIFQRCIYSLMNLDRSTCYGRENAEDRLRTGRQQQVLLRFVKECHLTLAQLWSLFVKRNRFSGRSDKLLSYPGVVVWLHEHLEIPLGQFTLRIADIVCCMREHTEFLLDVLFEECDLSELDFDKVLHEIANYLNTCSPVNTALNRYHLRLLRFALESGADPDIRSITSQDTRRPLWRFIWNPWMYYESRYEDTLIFVKYVDLLLRYGANPHLRDVENVQLSDCVYQGMHHGEYGLVYIRASRKSRHRERWDEILALLDTYSAIWHPSRYTHYSQGFKDRVFQFLLINARLRAQRRVYLPRDCRMIVISFLLEGEQQIGFEKTAKTFVTDIMKRQFRGNEGRKRALVLALDRDISFESVKGKDLDTIITCIAESGLTPEELDEFVYSSSRAMAELYRRFSTELRKDIEFGLGDGRLDLLRVKDLKARLRLYGLKTSGKKAVLLSRLKARLKAEAKKTRGTKRPRSKNT